jgi:CheY-like chemotaxis protein
MPSLHSPKIEVLIVDDEVQARELLSEFCRAQGYEVATANDRRLAIAALGVGSVPDGASRALAILFLSAMRSLRGDCPTEVRVHRREIYDQVREANQSALVKSETVALLLSGSK